MDEVKKMDDKEMKSENPSQRKWLQKYMRMEVCQ